MTLDIDDQYELLALHRALFVAKFSPQPIDRLVQTSPPVVSIMEKVLEKLDSIDWPTDAEKRHGQTGRRRSYLEWRENPPAGMLVEHFARHIIDNHYYHDASRDKRIDYLRLLAAPFIVSDDQLWQLAEKAFGASGLSPPHQEN